MSGDTKDFRTRCFAFVQEQSAGEWDDKTILADTEKLVTFVSAEAAANEAKIEALESILRSILKHGELANVDVGSRFTGGKKPASKDVWQFPRYMLTDIEAALQAATGERE